jgi:hypothetical protein
MLDPCVEDFRNMFDNSNSNSSFNSFASTPNTSSFAHQNGFLQNRFTPNGFPQNGFAPNGFNLHNGGGFGPSGFFQNFDPNGFNCHGFPPGNSFNQNIPSNLNKQKASMLQHGMDSYIMQT